MALIIKEGLVFSNIVHQPMNNGGMKDYKGFFINIQNLSIKLLFIKSKRFELYRNRKNQEL